MVMKKSTTKTTAAKTVEAKETAAAKAAEKKEAAPAKAAEKKEAAPAKTAQKKAPAAAAEKKAAKKPAAKKPAKETVYVQYLGLEFDTADLKKMVKNACTQEHKMKVGDIATMTLYVKPEENAVYYVVNDAITGKIEL